MPFPRRVTPSIKFTGTHLYIWVEKDFARVKCLAQEHNTMFDPETGSLSMRTPCLPQGNKVKEKSAGEPRGPLDRPVSAVSVA